MEPLKLLDLQLVEWANILSGQYVATDTILKLITSDYLIPLILGLILLALWFSGDNRYARKRNQTIILTAVTALGIANLTVLIINDFYFRARPFDEIELTLLFYLPTDSSFPANPTAASIAIAFSILREKKMVGTITLILALLWSMSRMVAGVSYLSDIAAGASIGIVASYISSLILLKLTPIPDLLIRILRILHLA
ncbi:phosphatase PAP2 family protein [SAR202 cluster bacterium AC-409-J13_OGT_754m]|nr:phosphatase PAP2 family protein [SAR202 cluster bacterium AC-409-J13_OGT_754m]